MAFGRVERHVAGVLAGRGTEGEVGPTLDAVVERAIARIQTGRCPAAATSTAVSMPSRVGGARLGRARCGGRGAGVERRRVHSAGRGVMIWIAEVARPGREHLRLRERRGDPGGEPVRVVEGAHDEVGRSRIARSVDAFDLAPHSTLSGPERVGALLVGVVVSERGVSSCPGVVSSGRPAPAR